MKRKKKKQIIINKNKTYLQKTIGDTTEYSLVKKKKTTKFCHFT